MLPPSRQPATPRVFDLMEDVAVTGFEDMVFRGPSEDSGLTAEETRVLIEFQRKVSFIFPDSAASRLARACGGVNVRTAQKWLSGVIHPIPQDAVDFVDEQIAELAKTGYVAALDKLLKDGTGQLDMEVVTSNLAAQYMKIAGSKIR